jgi:hypothetical protein
MSRPSVAFVAVLCIASLVYPVVPISPQIFFTSALGLAILAALFAGRSPVDGRPPRGRFLCDTCKLNDARYCSRPGRPNATECPDYRGR